MSKFILLFYIFNAFIHNVTAQESETAFKPNIFKYSKDDSPFSLGFGVAVGPGSLGPTAGFVADLDIYHVYLGLHTTKYGFLLSNSYQEAKANSLYLGYQFRTEKFMASIAGGIGNVKHHCTSGIGSNCYDVDESRRQSMVFKVEANILLSTYLALGISYNAINTNKTDLNSLLLSFKFGLFRNEY